MSDLQRIFADLPASGRFIFRDDFDSLDNWRVVSGSASVAESIVTLQGLSEIRSRRAFLYGLLIAAVKASVTKGGLRVGFTDESGQNYVVFSNDAFRYRSYIDTTEGTASYGIIESAYTIFTILWHPDELMFWVNGGVAPPYMGPKIPNKPMYISIKNLLDGETVQADFAVVYPELIGTWIGLGSGASQPTVGLSILMGTALPGGTNRIGIVATNPRLLGLPFTDSVTPLAANASFIGTARDTQISNSSPYDHLAFINAHAIADVPGTLIIQESPDGTSWVSVKSLDTISVKNPDGTTVYAALIEGHKVTLRYVRVAYLNGATAQTSFRLSSRVYS